MRSVNRLILTSALLLASAAPALARPSADPRAVMPLNSGWHFHFGDDQPAPGEPTPKPPVVSWLDVDLPHSWNRVGQYDARTNIPLAGRPVDKKQGIGWYQLDFAAPPLLAGKRAYLQFDAASRKAEVWLNGAKIGSHAGGFSRFRFDVTQALKGARTNHLVVKVDNSSPGPNSTTQDILPLTGDFFVQGGLYRPVSLIITAPAHFDLLDAGGSGVYARTTRIAPRSAEVAIVARLRNDRMSRGRYDLVSQLVDAQGRTAAVTTRAVYLDPDATLEAQQSLNVIHPHLWQGVQSPYLYKLVTELRAADGRLVDRITQDFGIRQIRIDPEKGLILNGRPTPLHGVGLHQDSMANGWAMTASDVARVVATLRDMGANTLRLTHYQHGEAIHRLADRYGLFVWDEIPLVTAWTTSNDQTKASEALLANARQQLREEIAQDRNHPSVAIWSIANEVDFGPNRPGFLNNGTTTAPDPVPLLRDLNALAHQLDPSRPTAIANCCEDRGMAQIPLVADVPDISAANRYFGWYYGNVEDLGPALDNLHRKRPAQPLALSEYGAGGALSIHTDNVLGGPVDAGGRNQPEEYQANLHERTWPQLAARPWLWATWLWNGFDFGSTARHEGDAVDINTKGLISYDGSVRKDAFYYYRAHWSDQPTVYITGRRYHDRAYAVTDIKVYSNAARTQLYVEGKSLGTQANCANHVCLWQNVTLAPGDNRIDAQADFAGKVVSDAIVWHLDPAQANAYRIDAGALVAASALAGRFGSDNFFVGGTAASMDIAQRYRPPVLAKIQGTPDRDLVATYRKGTFFYHLPVSPGRYRVTLTFAEPSLPAGQRVFDVIANGKPVIEALDVAAAAGAPLTAITRRVSVQAAGDGLTLAFKPRTGDAIVSAIAVEREVQAPE